MFVSSYLCMMLVSALRKRGVEDLKPSPVQVTSFLSNPTTTASIKISREQVIEILKKGGEALGVQYALEGPLLSEENVALMNSAMNEAGIVDQNEAAMLLGHIVIETGGFSTVQQSTTTPFMGCGFLQLSNQDNYLKASQDLYGSTKLIDDPFLVCKDINVGWKTTAWYWKKVVKPFPGFNQNGKLNFGATTMAINGIQCTGTSPRSGGSVGGGNVVAAGQRHKIYMVAHGVLGVKDSISTDCGCNTGYYTLSNPQTIQFAGQIGQFIDATLTCPVEGSAESVSAPASAPVITNLAVEPTKPVEPVVPVEETPVPASPPNRAVSSSGPINISRDQVIEILTKGGATLGVTYSLSGPLLAEENIKAMNNAFNQAGVSSLDEAAMILGHVIIETGGFSTVSEAPTTPFMGCGFLQITHRDNYLKASQELYGNNRLVDDPFLACKDIAVGWRTSAWYWEKVVKPFPGFNQNGKLNFGATTMAINGIQCTGTSPRSGGYVGGGNVVAAKQRHTLYTVAHDVLGVSTPASTDCGCNVGTYTITSPRTTRFAGEIGQFLDATLTC